MILRTPCHRLGLDLLIRAVAQSSFLLSLNGLFPSSLSPNSLRICHQMVFFVVAQSSQTKSLSPNRLSPNGIVAQSSCELRNCVCAIFLTDI